MNILSKLFRKSERQIVAREFALKVLTRLLGPSLVWRFHYSGGKWRIDVINSATMYQAGVFGYDSAEQASAGMAAQLVKLGWIAK